MKGNANQARGPVPSRNREGSTAEYVAASVWPNNIPRAHFRCEANTDKSWDIQQYPILSDGHLLTTAQSGDQQAFVELCRRYSPMVKKRIFSIVNNHEDAEDVLQDTLLRAYLHLGALRRTSTFSTWLTSIWINTALMTLRKRKTLKEGHTEFLNDECGVRQTAEYEDRSPNPESLHSRHLIILVVRREVQKLRPALRSIIRQYYGTECSVEESAKALNISISTAKSRLMRGRKTLRWYLRRRRGLDTKV